MNAEHLLDAMGLLDDDLIQGAEDCAPFKGRSSRAWLGLAASFAVVLVLGYGALRLGAGGSKSQENCSGGAGMNSGGSISIDDLTDPDAAGGGDAPLDGNGWSSGEQPGSDSAAMPEGPEGEPYAAIMVEGVLYWSTQTPVSGEVDESAVRTVTAYTEALPELDGQTNFSPDLSARYAMTDLGLVVRMDGEWILFEPVPPWER